MSGNVRTPGSTVSSRLLSILACFDIATPHLTLTEMSVQTGLPLTTTYRLVSELTEWGGLERLDDNRYRIGVRLWTTGSLAPRQRSLREAALPAMHDLYTATEESIQLVVLDGYEALCVEKIAAATAVVNRTTVGGRLPLHATAVGKCLLANSPREFFVKFTNRGLTRQTKYTITEPGRLANGLQDIRRTGVAVGREEMTLGTVSAASPIIAGDGRLLGALGIVAHTTKQLSHPRTRSADGGSDHLTRVRPGVMSSVQRNDAPPGDAVAPADDEWRLGPRKRRATAIIAA
jgi:DNA-binding IclR family transcriptional regulator